MSEIEITIEPHGVDGQMTITAAGVPRAVISFYAEKDQRIIRPGIWRHEDFDPDDRYWPERESDHEDAVNDSLRVIADLEAKFPPDQTYTHEQVIAALAEIKVELTL